MTFVCPYCLEELPDEVKTVEHVIPAKIGGNLEIPACLKCNGAAALAVDNPMMADGEIRVLRAMYDVRSPKRPSEPVRDQLIGFLSEQGAKALYRPRQGSAELEAVKASTAKLDDDGRFVIVAPTRNAEQHFEKELSRLRDAYPGKSVELENTELKSQVVTFEHRWQIGPDTWPRFAAKVALGLGPAVIDGFTTTREAKMLAHLPRQRLHRDLLPDGFELSLRPAQIEPGHRFHDLLRPDEHLLAVSGVGGALLFKMILFGELNYELAVRSDLSPPDRTHVWILDGQGLPFDSDLSSAGLALVTRLAEHGGAATLHRDRPSPEFKGVIRGAKVDRSLKTFDDSMNFDKPSAEPIK